MKRTKWLLVSLFLCAVALGGCARAARSTEGFAMTDSVTVSAPLEETWQATKEVLRERELDLYTRDKRGRFVAYSEMNRQLRIFTPKRVQYTITLDESAPGSTEVTIETMRQVYGVTLLTYPDWHDRKTEDNSEALAILEAIQQRLS